MKPETVQELMSCVGVINNVAGYLRSMGDYTATDSAIELDRAARRIYDFIQSPEYQAMVKDAEAYRRFMRSIDAARAE